MTESGNIENFSYYRGQYSRYGVKFVWTHLHLFCIDVLKSGNILVRNYHYLIETLHLHCWIKFLYLFYGIPRTHQNACLYDQKNLDPSPSAGIMPQWCLFNMLFDHQEFWPQWFLPTMMFVHRAFLPPRVLPTMNWRAPDQSPKARWSCPPPNLQSPAALSWCDQYCLINSTSND